MDTQKNSIEKYKLRLNNINNLRDYGLIRNENVLFSNLLYSMSGSKNTKELNEILDIYKGFDLDMMLIILTDCICNSYPNSQLPKLPILEVLKSLNGFDVNRYYTFKENTFMIDEQRQSFYTDSWLGGYPLYMAAKDAKVFKWCLENGADLSLKTKVKAEIAYITEDVKVRNYGASESNFLSSCLYNMKKTHDGLDCKELIYKMKRKTYIDVYNQITKENVSGENKKIVSFNDLLNAMVGDNKEVFKNIEHYRTMVETSKYRGKNLLMYAVDKNCFEWAKILVENKLVNPDDLSSANQSVLEYAINKKRPYMVKLLMDNKFYNQSDSNNGNSVFFAALLNYPKIAAKLYAHKIFPIDLISHPDANNYIYSLNEDKYQGYVIKETSAYENNLMTLDLEELGVILKKAPKKKI